MKKLSKILALIITISLLSGILCACGEKEVHTGESFTYWLSLPSQAQQTVTSYNDLMMFQEMEKVTGTKVEFLHPTSGSTGSEAFQILLASGDYPDMIEYNWASYAGGPQQAIDDGIIISLNDYLEDYAPNYYDWLEGEKGKENNYLYKAQSISSSGNYYGFKSMNIGNYRGFGGLYIRKDMLDKWGLDVPVTIDDWDNVLATAKENGIKYPLTGAKSMFSFNGADVFNTAWNVGKSFYIDDNNKVRFGPFEKNYKKYVAKMAEWVKKGYVDIDYVTNTSTNLEGSMTNGTSIATYGWVGGSIGKLLPAMAERNPEYNVVACPFPVMKEGNIPWFQELDAEAKDPTLAISISCGIDNEDRYKEAIKWCDYLYSDEGIVLKSFGVEGDTYTVEKGEDGEEHYIYTDKIFDHEKIGAHSVEAALYRFFRPGNGPGFGQHPDYLNGFYPYEQQKEAIKIWNEHIETAKKHKLPTLSYTGEEAGERAAIIAKAKDNLDAAISNIILGKESIDTYDEAISKAKKDGYDRMLETTQAAYDRYMDILK